jgi:hypothetical protein
MADDDRPMTEDERLELEGRLSSWLEANRHAMPEAAVDRLDSSEARARARAIGEVLDHGLGQAIPRLKELLEDDAAVVSTHGGDRVVVEIRARALLALEGLYALSRKPVDFDPVVVSRAMRDGEVRERWTCLRSELGKERSAELERQAQTFVRQQTAPDDDVELLVPYRFLQLAGAVEYRDEAVVPDLYLTPLQIEVCRSQLASARPLPHVRVESLHGDLVLGYIFIREGRILFDFCEIREAQKFANFAARLAADYRGNVPQVAFSGPGVAKIRDTGKPIRGRPLSVNEDPEYEVLRSFGVVFANRARLSLVGREGDELPLVRPTNSDRANRRQ